MLIVVIIESDGSPQCVAYTSQKHGPKKDDPKFSTG